MLVELNGIKIETDGILHKQPSTDYYSVTIRSQCDRDQLSKLTGSNLFGNKIIGVESFAVQNQTNRPVSLVIRLDRFDFRNATCNK